jgi:hypothetical protein
MLTLKSGDVINPIVKTSNFGGLPMEDLAELCVAEILSISETSPPAIKEQAKLFQDKLRVKIRVYLKKAAKSQKDTCIQQVLNGGYSDAADLLRRI